MESASRTLHVRGLFQMCGRVDMEGCLVWKADIVDSLGFDPVLGFYVKRGLE